MTALTNEQKQFYSAMDSLFRQPGWELLRQGWQAEADNLPNIVFFNAKSMDDVRDARIRHSLLRELLDLSSQMEKQQEHLISENPEPAGYDE